MDLKVPTVVKPESWEILTGFVPNPDLLRILYNHLESIVPEWMRLFGDVYEDEDERDIIASSELVTGMLREGKNAYTYGAVVVVVVRDPERYYTVMTRYVSVYLDGEFNADKVTKSGTPPQMDENCCTPGIVKK